MAGHVINPPEGNAGYCRNGLGKGKSDEEGTDQPRPLGHGDQIDIVKGDFSPLQCLGDNRVDRFKMLS